VAITLSQHVETNGTGASETVTVSAVSAGDHVILLVYNNGSGNTTGVSGLGATWTQLRTLSAGPYFDLWSGVGCSAGGTTITVTFGGATSAAFSCSIWAGAGLVQSSAITGATSTAPTTASVTPTLTSQMVVGGWSLSGGTSRTFSSFVDTPSAWTTDVTNTFESISTVHLAHITGITSAALRTATSSVNGAWGGYGVVLDVATPAVYRASPIRARRNVPVARASVI
jgi:hypothetical protein